MSELKEQIEKAFNYRGHVTVTLKSGAVVAGYLFNREFDNPRSPENNYIEVVAKNSDEKKRFKIADVAAVELTGKDHAESYEDGKKRMSQDG